MAELSTICWDCKRAVMGCSWSKRYTPVPGWNAIKTQIAVNDKGRQRYCESYKVIECPLFEADGR